MGPPGGGAPLKWVSGLGTLNFLTATGKRTPAASTCGKHGFRSVGVSRWFYLPLRQGAHSVGIDLIVQRNLVRALEWRPAWLRRRQTRLASCYFRKRARLG